MKNTTQIDIASLKADLETTIKEFVKATGTPREKIVVALKAAAKSLSIASDRVGNPLARGDTVVFSVTGCNRLRIGEVRYLTPKGVAIKSDSHHHELITWRRYSDVVFISSRP